MMIVRIVRWLTCFPVAWIAAFAAFACAKMIFSQVSYGGSLLDWILGPAPGVLRVAVPAAVLVLVGAAVAPNEGRGIVFVFFGLSLVWSPGLLDVQRSVADDPGFWLIGLIGHVVGAFGGLLLGLRLQARRSRPAAGEARGAAQSPAS